MADDFGKGCNRGGYGRGERIHGLNDEHNLEVDLVVSLRLE